MAGPIANVPATPLVFEQNVGQSDQQVKFLAHARNAMVWLTGKGPVLGFSGPSRTASYVAIRFAGGNLSPKIEGAEKRPGISNYFMGRDPGNWHTDVPQYGKVRYRDVYPAIDVVFYGNPSNLEYDFVLRPGARPSEIQLAFDGIRELSIDSDGSLLLKTAYAEIRNLAPSITQDGKRVAGHWTRRGKNRAGFVVDRFDRSRPLVIDPVLTYGTYLGGATADVPGGGTDTEIHAIAVDAQGNIIVAGTTNAVDFPTRNSLYNSIPAHLLSSTGFGFVSKIDPSVSGSASLVYSTFFNDTGQMVHGGEVNAVALDRNGNVYFTGANGDELPVQNPLPGQSSVDVSLCVVGTTTVTNVCLHAFIAELSAAGNKLLFCSYLTGSSNDVGTAVTVDAKGNIYVAGITTSVDFPLAGNFVQSGLNGGAETGFVSVISASYTLTYSTTFGSGGARYGGGGDGIQGIAADSNGRIFIAGAAGGTGLPLGGGFQPNYPGGPNQPVAAFAAILNPAMQPAVVYSTYLGGSDYDSQAGAVATDGKGNIYVAGYTGANHFPVTATAVRGPGGGPHAFVTKLNPTAQGTAQLAYSTILGGSFADIANRIAVDSTGNITVVGQTNSFDFETTANAIQSSYAGLFINGTFTTMGFLARIDPTLSGAASLLYSSYAGGTRESALFAVALDSTGEVVAAGGVSSIGAPVPSGYQPSYIGTEDAYLVRFDMSQTGPILNSVENAASLGADPNGTISPGMIVSLKGTGLGPTIATNGAIDTASGKVSTNVAGVEVLIDNTPCPLLYLSATQINAVAPYELAAKAGQFVQVQVSYNGVPGTVANAVVGATNPGIFSFDDGSGQGAILNQDGTVNGPSNAAARGSLIQIFATGEGQTVPPGIDGAIANQPTGSIPHPAAALSVIIGGAAVPASAVTYAGTLPGGVAGALQIDAMVPANTPTGSAIPIVLTIGANSSPKKLTMAVQ